MVRGSMPAAVSTTGALLPAAEARRGIQPSKPRPLTKTILAAATALASAGAGWKVWLSPPGPTNVVTATWSRPTSETRSPRMEKLATTFSGSCALAEPGAAKLESEARTRVWTRRRAKRGASRRQRKDVFLSSSDVMLYCYASRWGFGKALQSSPPRRPPMSHRLASAGDKRCDIGGPGDENDGRAG